MLKQLYDLCRVRGHSGCHCTPSVSVSVSFSLLQILLTPSTECGQTAAGVAADCLIVRGSGGLWFERFQPLKEEIVTSWTHNCPRETDLVTVQELKSKGGKLLLRKLCHESLSRVKCCPLAVKGIVKG